MSATVTTTIKTAIIDDEPLSREKIQLLLNEDLEIDLVACCKNGEEGLKSIKKEKPDLVFLDIQMPGLNGMELARSLDTLEQIPFIIFITAFDGFSLEAFELSAVDYLLKPFSKDRFTQALLKAKQRIRSQSIDKVNQRVDDLAQMLEGPTKYARRIAIKNPGKITFLPVQDIQWAQSDGNYIKIFTEQKTYHIRETMNNLQKKLNPDQFYRIHRSTIVNIEEVKEVEKWFHGDYMVHLLNGQKLNMSRNYKGILSNF